jgi:hypothetical protein
MLVNIWATGKKSFVSRRVSRRLGQCYLLRKGSRRSCSQTSFAAPAPSGESLFRFLGDLLQKEREPESGKVGPYETVFVLWILRQAHSVNAVTLLLHLSHLAFNAFPQCFPGS